MSTRSTEPVCAKCGVAHPAEAAPNPGEGLAPPSRELVRAEIAQTVPDMADADDELRYLIEVLAAG
jgi:hypothetical protein